MCLEKVISGGQTGVDRAALDVALELQLPCGGRCPRGRRAEDGPIPDRYPLEETESAAYIERTRLNLADADATLVLTFGRIDRGTRATIRIAADLGKPCRTLDLGGPPEPDVVTDWLAETGARIVNVAGPRESRAPGIYAAAAAYLRTLLVRSDYCPNRGG